MQALILAGGKGTRLRPLTVFTPKPITPICNRPFLLYQIETLKKAGITDITLCLSYQPDKIEQLLGDGASLGVHLKYTVEPQPMGTAGAYKFAADLIREPTVIFNGDILTDIDLQAVIKQHTERKATATIVLTPVEDPTAYGLVETAPDGRVLRFVEKPKADAITCNTINAGTYILEPQVLDMIPAGEPYMFETGVFPGLLEKGEAFFAHTPDNTYWIDIGTPARYLQAHLDLLADKVTRMPLTERRGKCDIATSAEVDKLSLIGDDCVIKPGAQIINSVLGAGCYVEEKAEVRDSVIWPHSRIGSNAVVTSAIVGRGAHIGRSVLVNGGAVLGDKTSLTDYTIIGATN